MSAIANRRIHQGSCRRSVFCLRVLPNQQPTNQRKNAHCCRNTDTSSNSTTCHRTPDLAPASATKHSLCSQLSLAVTSNTSNISSAFCGVLITSPFSFTSVPPPNNPFLSLSRLKDFCDSRIAGSFALYSIVYPSYLLLSYKKNMVCRVEC